MALFLYFALLVFWLALIRPGRRLSGRHRLIVLVAAAAGLIAAVYEALMIFVITPGMSAPIRIDILLIVPVLWVVYAVAVGVLLWVQRSKANIVRAVVLGFIGLGIVSQWAVMNNYSADLTRIFHDRNAMLFEAKFRNLDTYQSYFGAFDAQKPESPTAHPVGHWKTKEHDHYTRLIVNAEGVAWLFYRCGATECTYRSTDAGIQPGTDGAWDVGLSQGGRAVLALHLTPDGSDRLTTGSSEYPIIFEKAPPPINPAPAPEALTYLGPFTGLDCESTTAWLSQVWLWQEGMRLYGVGVFARYPMGYHAQFISPRVMGVAESGDGVWRFEWDTDNWRGDSAEITLSDGGATLKLDQRKQLEVETTLTRSAIIEAEVMALAPRTNGEDWQRWFEVIFTGHFVSGDIPACETN